MDEKQMIDDLVKMLDSGMTEGVGHVNVDFDETEAQSKNVQTMGCRIAPELPWPAVFSLSRKGLMIINKPFP